MPSHYFCEHMQPLAKRYAFSSSVLSLSLRISEPLKDVDSFKVVSTWIFGIKPAFSLQKEACQALYQHIICKYTLQEEKISIGFCWERDCNQSGEIMQQLQNFIFCSKVVLHFKIAKTFRLCLAKHPHLFPNFFFFFFSKKCQFQNIPLFILHQ
jgi:hypothetical protein